MESKSGDDGDGDNDYKSEAKGGGGSKPNRRGSALSADVSPTISLFTDFCTSEVFGDELSAFEKKHCASFKGADLDGEQNLEWTDLHQRYVAIIEDKMDSFCKDNGLKPELVFEEVSRIVDDSGLAEFLPQVMLNCEYSYFAKQMKYQAEAEDNRVSAAAASHRRASTMNCSINISGVYENSSDNPFQPKVWDEFLKTVGCPWVFRKLIVTSSSNIKDIFIYQDANTMIFKYKVKFFGIREIRYELDGKAREVLNLWKVPLPQRAFIDDKRKVICVEVKPHPALLPNGWAEHTFSTRTNSKGEKELVWNQYLNNEKGLEITSQQVFVQRGDGQGETEEQFSSRK